MKNILSLLFICIATLTFAQNIDVKIKKGLASVNGAPYCRFEGGGFTDTGEDIYNNEGVLIIRVKFMHGRDIYQNGHNYRSAWHEFIFEGFPNYHPELPAEIGYRKICVKELYRYKVIDEKGKINEEGLKAFCNYYNERLSEKYR
jgi:hypothetical protein